MIFDELTAISPIDGRYRKKVEELSSFFSEQALIKYRVRVEALYLIELSKKGVIKRLSKKEIALLVSLFENFGLKDARKVKRIEKQINHDVKAVEYFIKTKLNESWLKEFVHFALTSEDVNNLAYSLLIRDCLEAVYLPTLKSLIKEISRLAKKHRNEVMLSRTHGQPASPTTLGKELSVFVYRLKEQVKLIPKLTGKLNGVVGNYNAHNVAFPKINWIKFSQDFVKGLSLSPNVITTQIENHDVWAELFHVMIRINNILLDFNQDIWSYISFSYLKQKVITKEVGSSTMPHKINPIDFENSEGNLGVANSLLEHLANKLPISRLQRDLSDSTVSRNIGLTFGHCLLAYKSCLNGLGKIEVNRKVIKKDLKNHPEVITEAIQVVLRREGVKQPYEILKKATRGKKVTLEFLHEFIDRLEISTKVKHELKNIKPENYIGLTEKLVKVSMKE